MNIPVNKINSYTACAVMNLIDASRGNVLIMDSSIVATPKTVWQHYGFRDDTDAMQETLKLCYVPIMLSDYLQQYCRQLVNDKVVTGLLKNKCNFVSNKISQYLSLISPYYKDHYIDGLLSCFEGIENVIANDLEKYRQKILITSAKDYPDMNKRKLYAHIMAMLMLMSTMFNYIRYADIKPDTEMKVIFDVIYSQMLGIFDKTKDYVRTVECEDMKTSIHILRNKIDKFIGML